MNLPGLYLDRGSLYNLTREIGSAYAARSQQQELATEPIQYADLSAVLNELLESEESQVGREYWTSKDYSNLYTLKLSFERQTPRETASSSVY